MESTDQIKNLKITHIYHSGVMIETNSELIIIDYFHEDGAFDEKIFLDYLSQSAKDFFYFVTHGHEDHFTEKILTPSFQSPHGNTQYIVSNDLAHLKDAHKNIISCSPYEEFQVAGLHVSSFGSTDQGVSYLIEIQNSEALVFHSGDLNWWHWDHFSEEEKLQEKQDFFNELQKIQAKLLIKNQPLNVAFVPVDPRLKESYYLAGDAFLASLQPVKLFPLHFRQDYSITEKFKAQSSSKNRVESIKHALQTFNIRV